MEDNKKPPTEAAMLGALASGSLEFPPLTLSLDQAVSALKSSGRVRIDGVVVARWGEQEFTFAAECKALATPKVFAAAIDEASRGAQTQGLRPLILVPYLSPEQILELENRGMSGIDFCGNGVVTIPGTVLVVRTGQPNRFRAEGRIKNVYRKNSGVVAQMFLLCPRFTSVGEVAAKIAERDASISLATISKVIATLDADLIVGRTKAPGVNGRELRLLQPDKLLDLLARNYSPPEITRTITGKISLSAEELRDSLTQWRKKSGLRVRLTGESSVAAYATMPREDMRSYYCGDVGSLVSAIGESFRETERFANLKLLETRDEFVYFGGDWDGPFQASPIQTYMELSGGDKRDRETAEQVRKLILDRVKDSAAKDSHGPTDPKPARPAP